MSGNSKSSTEDIINACENKPNQGKWMEAKKCFQDLQGELYDLMQKYPGEVGKRKVPVTPRQPPPDAVMTKTVKTVLEYIENVQIYNPKSACKKEAAKREFLDMAHFVYELKQIDKEQGNKLSQNVPSSPNPATVKSNIEKQKQGTASTQRGKEKEEDKKGKKSADEYKVEEFQKKIRDLESKVKQLETRDSSGILNVKEHSTRIRDLESKVKQMETTSFLIEKLHSAEQRCKILEDEKENFKQSIEKLQSRSKFLDEEITKLQSRNIDYENQLQELHQEYLVKEAQCGDLRLRLNNSESRNADVESDNKYLKEQVDELTMSLNSFASKQLSEGNPIIADLSDQNRPTKIGEKFGSLYDDEWSEAFDAITTTEKSEDDAINYLINIIQESYTFCTHTAHEQLEKLTEKMKTLMAKFEYKDKEGRTHETNSSLDDKPNIGSARAKYARDYRKAAACESLLGVKQMFKERVLKEKLDKLSGETKDLVIAYVDKCTELIWFMVVQDPPMVIEIPEPGKKFNANAFKPYKTKGKLVKLAVWPAVKLFENGELISKGYALPE